MARARTPVVMTELGRYECRHCSARFAWASSRPIDPPEQRTGLGGRRGGGRPPAYCSDQCSNRARKRNATYVYTCQMCGAISSKRHTFTTYCSRSCAARAQHGWRSSLPPDHWARWYGKSSAWQPPKPTRPRWVAGHCQECGDSYVDDWLATSSSRYCSAPCRTRAGKRRRRLLTRGAARVDRGISWRSIAKRHGMDCYLCGSRCDPHDVYVRNGNRIYGDLYPSEEHLVPLSKGGTHTWDNVALAHRRCNSRKGNRQTPHPPG